MVRDDGRAINGKELLMATRETDDTRHAIYLIEQLELVGFLGALGSRDAPFVIGPLLAVRGGGSVIVPPYTFEATTVRVDAEMSRDELARMVEDGEATALPSEPALHDACLYVPLGNGLPQYVVVSEARTRLMDFASQKRKDGDRYFTTDKKSALHAYTLAAAVSQSPDDYARMLLCEPTGVHARFARSALAKLGENEAELCRKIKEGIEKGEGNCP